MLFSHGVISSSPPLMAVTPSRGPPTPTTTTFARRLLQPTACNTRLCAQLKAGLGVCVCVWQGDLRDLLQIPLMQHSLCPSA